jgi:hypothetical protein
LLKKYWKSAEKRLIYQKCGCECEVRPLQIRGAHTCACAPVSGSARCVRATKKKGSQLTPWYFHLILTNSSILQSKSMILKFVQYTHVQNLIWSIYLYLSALQSPKFLNLHTSVRTSDEQSYTYFNKWVADRVGYALLLQILDEKIIMRRRKCLFIYLRLLKIERFISIFEMILYFRLYRELTKWVL